LSDQGEFYGSFVESELLSEQTRRAELNVQARAVVTASGAQFGLTTGLVVFVRGKNYLPDHTWSWLFGTALVLYLLSVALGLERVC